jgi:hypothetical protein
MGVGPGRSEPASNCRNCRNYWNLFEIAGEFPAASSRQGELVALLWPPTVNTAWVLALLERFSTRLLLGHFCSSLQQFAANLADLMHADA